MNSKETIAWYDSHAAQYAGAIEGWYASDILNEFTSRLPPGGKVLDAGCAAGRDSGYFADSGFKVTGIDLSHELIKIAKHTYPNIEFIHGDFIKMDFPDNYFDGVWSHASLVHMETITDASNAIKEFYRVLNKNGVIQIIVKAPTGKEKTAVISDSISKHDRFFRYYTQSEMKKLLIKNNFQLISTEAKYNSTRSEVKWITLLARK